VDRASAGERYPDLESDVSGELAIHFAPPLVPCCHRAS
jgi:hypothetical protein